MILKQRMIETQICFTPATGNDSCDAAKLQLDAALRFTTTAPYAGHTLAAAHNPDRSRLTTVCASSSVEST